MYYYNKLNSDEEMSEDEVAAIVCYLAALVDDLLDEWETRMLGADEKYVRVSKDQDDGLITVQLKLPKETVDVYKKIAQKNGTRYTTLMRNIIINYLLNK